MRPGPSDAIASASLRSCRVSAADKAAPSGLATWLSYRGLVVIPMLFLAGCCSEGCTPAVEQTSEEATVGVSEPLASRSVSSDGVEFRALVLQQWTIPARGSEQAIELKLEIANRSPAEVQLNLIDTIKLRLSPAGGNPLAFQGGRNGLTANSGSLAIAAGKTHEVKLPARLSWSSDGASLRLIGSDDTGATWHIDGLKPGKYALSFEYENSTKSPNYGAGQWIGSVKTPSLDIEVQSLEDRL